MIIDFIEKIKKPVTIKFCTDYLRKKGIATLDVDKTTLRFKLYNLNFELCYDHDRIIFKTTLSLKENVDYDCILRAMNKINQERWIVKSYLDNEKVEDENAHETVKYFITFSFESFCTSRSSFYKLYEYAIYVLYDTIDFHKQCYNQYLEEKNKILQKDSNNIGFRCNSEKKDTILPPEERQQNHKIGFIQ